MPSKVENGTRKRGRTAVETDKFLKQLAKIIEDIEEADEFLRAVKDTLSNFPESGAKLVDDPPVWAIGKYDTDLPYSILITYTFTDSEVLLISIESLKDQA
jgi:hypothetical protein